MILLLAAFMPPTVVCAQGDIHALETSLKGKQMQLRSYSADSVAHYELVDGKLIVEPVKMRTFGMFTTQSVKLKKDRIVFEGTRATVVRDVKENRIWLTGSMPMKIEVKLHGTDPAAMIPNLSNMLFFPDAKVAAAGLPEQVADMLPFDVSRTPKVKRDFLSVFDDGRWLRVNRNATKIVPPALVSSVEPEFSAAARGLKVGGSVTLVFYVSDTGHVGEIWLAEPMGLGLDESAAEAVRQYLFKPEQCDGRAVGTVLTVDVNFQVF
jgi:TonB family protein